MLKDYQITLQNGVKTILYNADLDAEKFTEQLNDHTKPFINIGGMIIVKHLLASIMPVTVVPEEADEVIVEDKPIVDFEHATE